MGFSPYSTEIRQFEIPPSVLLEQTAKYNVCQYFCLYKYNIMAENKLVKLNFERNSYSVYSI